jgi:3-dehydroquinate synthetase
MVIESRGEIRRQIVEMLKRFNLPYETEFSAEELIEAAFADKKRIGGKINLIISKQIGEFELKVFDMDELAAFVKEGKEAAIGGK